MREGFFIDPENLELVKDDVGIGKVVELSPADAGLLAPHIPNHPDTIYAVASGVALPCADVYFRQGQDCVAVEWVRKESKPKPGEPECNVNRYLFGWSAAKGTCIGLDVTDKKGGQGTGQVGDHWTTFEDVINRHFPE